MNTEYEFVLTSAQLLVLSKMGLIRKFRSLSGTLFRSGLTTGYTVVSMTHREILDTLAAVDAMIPTDDFDQGDIASLYMNVDAGLERYYEAHGITD